MSNTSLWNKSTDTRSPAEEPACKQTIAVTLSEKKPDTSSYDKQFWLILTQALPKSVNFAWTQSDHQVLSTKLAKQAVPPDFERLTEGTIKLAQLVLCHAVQNPKDPKDAQSRAREVTDFRTAYSAIVQSVPEARRQQLLRSMREGLEEAAKAELESVPVPAAGSGGDAPVSTSDFMAGLERQEAEQRERDTNEGVLVTAAKLAAHLKITPQGLHYALKAKRIFTLPGPSGERVYPAFFADPKQDRRLLEKVSKALGDLPGAAKWDFFMSPRVSLGKRTPLEALAKGKFEAVMLAANAFAEE